jgi:hypothetical protein
MSDWDKIGGVAEDEKLDDGKRAGGVAGLVDTEAWWSKGGICFGLAKTFKAMSAYERVSFVNHPEIKPLVMAALDEELAKWAKRDAEVVPAMLVSKGKSPRKRNVRAYWMRTIESLDRSKKGSERLVGDWVQEPGTDCDAGELVVCGLRYPDKVYALLKVTGGDENTQLFASVRPDVFVKGVRSLGEWPSFSDFMEVVERELIG